jgi:hypothetical protein
MPHEVKYSILVYPNWTVIRSKITLDNNPIIEQVSDFNYLGCNVTYKYDDDLNKKINKFQSICAVISRKLKIKTRKETNLKFYKVMATPVLLYGCETWTLKKDWNRIQAAEIKYLRTVKGCTKIDLLRNEDIQNELGIALYMKK